MGHIPYMTYHYKGYIMDIEMWYVDRAMHAKIKAYSVNEIREMFPDLAPFEVAEEFKLVPAYKHNPDGRYLLGFECYSCGGSIGRNDCDHAQYVNAGRICADCRED